jgi:Domain of unknown function (DUF4383)
MDVRRFAQVLGAVYILVGVVGFALTGLGGFASSTPGGTIVLFDVNPLHNVVHLGVGLAWLASSARVDTARTVSLVIGAVYLLVGVLGLFLTGNDSLNILALNQADNLLHLGTGALALLAALSGRRQAATA